MVCSSRRIALVCLISLAAGIAATARAQVVAPSLYTNAIQVQGEPAGTEYDDWAGVTVADMDPADNVGVLDIANVQIANDEDFIYIRATLHNAASLSLAKLYLGFDNDQDSTTGFDVFGVGEIGTELGYQTDFPFAQDTGIFNVPNTMLTGGPFGNGGALIFPFWNEAGAPSGTQIEWAVPRDVVITYPLGGDPDAGFPNPSFDFVVWADEGLGDITNAISYTLAEPPAGAPGDFDDDEDVDGADFLEWQQGLGGEFNAQHLEDWKLNFGTGGGVAAVASIPEPASLLLVALGVLGIASRRTRRV